jgi:hypothetical protein
MLLRATQGCKSCTHGHGYVIAEWVVVTHAVHESGLRGVIGSGHRRVESGAFRVEVLHSLMRRGLAGMRLAIPTSTSSWRARSPGCSDRAGQRCSVRFVTNVLANCRRDQRGVVASTLREILNAESREQARARLGHAIERLEPVAPQIRRHLEEGRRPLLLDATGRHPRRDGITLPVGRGAERRRPVHSRNPRLRASRPAITRRSRRRPAGVSRRQSAPAALLQPSTSSTASLRDCFVGSGRLTLECEPLAARRRRERGRA